MRHLQNDALRANRAHRLEKRTPTLSVGASFTSSPGSATTTALDSTHTGSSASTATVTLTNSNSDVSFNSSLSSMSAIPTIEPTALTTTELGGGGLTVVVVISCVRTAVRYDAPLLTLRLECDLHPPPQLNDTLRISQFDRLLPPSLDILFLSSSSSALVSAHANPLSSTSRLSPGAIAGVSVASVVAFFALLAVLSLLWRNKRKEQEEDDLLDMMVPPGGPDPYAASYAAGRLSENTSFGGEGGGPGPMMASPRVRHYY
ncbi:hypothetical protein JCM1841_004088 [Sporobolomyces salmonicolor]